MSRFVLFVCTLWAIIGAPVLCTTGVLAHECECEEVCVCEHEAACETDPCGEILLRKDESRTDVQVPGPAACPVPVAAPEPSGRAAAPRRPHPRRTPPLGVPHASDWPLLS